MNQDTSKKATNLVEKALVALLFSHPFYSSKGLKLAWIEDATCKTAWTDGTQYGFNPEWIATLDVEETAGVEAHEVSHNTLNHNLRIFGRDPDLWNEVCDKIINPLLKKEGFKLPKGAMMPEPDEVGMYEEELYDHLLKKRQKQGKGQGQGQGQSPVGGQRGASQGQQKGQIGKGGCIGEVRPFPSPSGKPTPTDTEIKQQEQAQNIDTELALTSSRMAGRGSLGLERLIKRLMEPVIPWREVLARYVDNHARSRHDWKRPNKRYIIHDTYMPSLHNMELGHIGVFDDTSGSHFSREQQEKALGELRGILASYSNVSLTLIFCDDKVTSTLTIEGSDDIEVNIPKPKGGGGTDFRPPFEWIENNQIELACAIYITDGECNWFPKVAPDYDVLWVLTERHESFSPPFGEVIVMRD